jgi:transcriptional antiterminator Rof (Rho-off)
MSENSYKPVDCSLYDRYELWAVQGKLLTINTLHGTHRGVIRTLEAISGEEWMVLQSDERIRLDHIASVSEA